MTSDNRVPNPAHLFVTSYNRAGSGGELYRITKIHNTIEWKVGQYLKKDELQDLITVRGLRVTIT